MTISETLAHFIATATVDRLSTREVTAAREAISDCMGCIIAGSRTELGPIVRRVALASSAAGSATIIGSSRTATAQAAALANGTQAHALDYDDILWTLYGHPSSVALPAAMACAEAVGACGRDLILAYAIGVEVMGKLGRAVNPHHYEHGWHATASIGVIGGAAAAAKLLGLNEQQIAMALGIAASEACGLRRNFGTMTKPFHAGNAARGGVLAAELAALGFDSEITAFEGRFGWCETLNAGTVPNVAELAATLGKPWELIEPGIVLKRYPACGGTHCALDAMIALKTENKIELAEIEGIECAAHPLAKKVLLYPHPKTGLEGKFSMEYCLAVAAVEADAGLRHFEEKWLTDQRVTELLPRIQFIERDDLAATPSADGVPAEVTIRARGQRYTRKVTIPAGDPRNPMRRDERRSKFLDCTNGIIADETSITIWQEFERLEASDLKTLLAELRRLSAAD